MDKNTFVNMDVNILVSMINMKIRDYYGTLEAYCEDNNIENSVVIEKLSTGGFEYNKEINQFR